MKKLFLTVALAFCIMGICPCVSVLASETDGGFVQLDDSRIDAAKADVIETKYRWNNGIIQWRRWNASRGKWVDPYWINL